MLCDTSSICTFVVCESNRITSPTRVSILGNGKARPSYRASTGTASHLLTVMRLLNFDAASRSVVTYPRLVYIP